MKKIAVIFILFAFVLSPAAGAAESKLGYVDVATVFDNYQKTKDQDLILKEKGEKKEVKRNELINALRRLEDEMVLLARDAQAKKQEELIEKKRQLEDFDRGVQRELGESRNKIVREIFEDIDQVITSYGKKNGYDFIFSEKVLLFQNKRNDLTPEISKELAKTYKKK